jgi:hypothetical protein
VEQESETQKSGRKKERDMNSWKSSDSFIAEAGS